MDTRIEYNTMVAFDTRGHTSKYNKRKYNSSMQSQESEEQTVTEYLQNRVRWMGEQNQLMLSEWEMEAALIRSPNGRGVCNLPREGLSWTSTYHHPDATITKILCNHTYNNPTSPYNYGKHPHSSMHLTVWNPYSIHTHSLVPTQC